MNIDSHRSISISSKEKHSLTFYFRNPRLFIFTALHIHSPLISSSNKSLYSTQVSLEIDFDRVVITDLQSHLLRQVKMFVEGKRSIRFGFPRDSLLRIFAR